jgi:hypothetical protein
VLEGVQELERVPQEKESVLENSMLGVEVWLEGEY